MKDKSTFPPHRHWFRHMAAVPKGFLRLQALELLMEKPCSGSEIMDEVEKKTGGCWRPGPGSIYPMLSWLQDEGYIKEVSTREVGVKRYSITEKGKKLLEEQRRIRGEFERKFFGMPFFSALWFNIPPEDSERIKGSVRKLLRSFLELRMNLEKKFSKEALRETIKILEETAEKIENVNRRLRGDE